MTFNPRTGVVFAAFAALLLLAVAARQGHTDMRLAYPSILAIVAIEALTIFRAPFWRRSP
jgi:hypothetical protein